MFELKSTGDFNNLESFLKHMEKLEMERLVGVYAQEGVAALAAYTPEDSGLAASSWGYIIESHQDGFSVVWTNDNVENGFPVAIMIQYGYGTGTGGYVQGRDYINPAIAPIFDRIADDIWKAVTSA